MIYIIVYTYLLFLSIVYLFFDKVKNDKVFISISFWSLILVAIFRVDTGTDFHSYLKFWENIDLFSTTEFSYNYVEFGFRLFISILKLFTSSDFIYFALLAIIPLIVFKKAIYILNLNIVISLFFYFSFFYFAYLLNGIGQSFTISFLLLSIKFTLDKKLKIALFIAILATLFHYSGLAIFLIIPFVRLKLSIHTSFIFSVLIGLLFYKFELVNVLLELLFPSKFDVYYSFFQENTSIFQVLTKGGIYIILYFCTYLIKSPNYNKIFNAYSLGFFLFVCLLDQNMLATKIFMIFKPLEIILIGIFINEIKQNKLLRLSIFIIFAIPYTYQFLVNLNNPDFIYHSRLFNF